MAFAGLALSKQWSVMYILGTIKKERNKDKTDITNKRGKVVQGSVGRGEIRKDHRVKYDLNTFYT